MMRKSTKLFLTILSTLMLNAVSAKAGVPIAGPANAPVTIEEFVDFECGYCARGANTMKEILKNYPDKVRLVLRSFPVHEGAVVAAKAFVAVSMQSSSLAYSFQESLFNHQEELREKGEPFLYELAQKLGVDVTQMKTDMNSAAVERSLAEDRSAADAHNFKGTPSFMIGTEPVQGALPYVEIKKIIDRQLKN